MLSLKYIIIPFSAAVVSQCIKVLIEFIKYKVKTKFNVDLDEEILYVE